MTITINSQPVLRGSLHLPRFGVWRAEIECEGEITAGTATLASDGVSFVGKILRAGKLDERGRAVVWGGAGGLATEIPARFYAGPLPIRRVLSDLLRDCGETLSGDSTASEIDRDVPAWTRRRAPASDELWRIAEQFGFVWRVLADGSVWVGQETWTDVPTFEHETLDDDPSNLIERLGVDALVSGLLPGRTHNGRQLAEVTYEFTADAVRATLRGWRGSFNAGASESLRATIKQQSDHTFAALWPAEVVSQDADGTLQLTLQPDLLREKRTLPGMTAVPLRVPAPGVTITVAAGARVLVGFEGADPSRPRAMLWDGGVGNLSLMQVGSTGAQFVALANLVDARVETLRAAINTVALAVPTATPIPVALSSVAATKLKAQ